MFASRFIPIVAAVSISWPSCDAKPFLAPTKGQATEEEVIPGYTPSMPVPNAVYPYKHNTVSYLDHYPPMMVGATWGVAGCIGAPGFPQVNTTWTLMNGCATVPAIAYDDIGSADACEPNKTGVLTTRAPSKPVFMGLMQPAAGGSCCSAATPTYPMDAIAAKFSWQIDSTTLDWSDFEFTMSDGSKKPPYGLNIIPDADGDEQFTVTLYGNLGTSTYGQDDNWRAGVVRQPEMVKLTVVDDLIVTNGTHQFNVKGAEFSGGNLDYTNGGVLAMAYVYPYDPSKDYANVNADNCSKYPDTTHVVTAQTMGGTTYDGINGYAANHPELFDVELRNGNMLDRSAYLGLADIDGDDFTSICLHLKDGAQADAFTKLHMHCDHTDPCKYWALPKGNKQEFAPCTNTQPQPIAHPRCPDNAVCPQVKQQ